MEITSARREEWNGPTLAVQMRAAGLQDAAMAAAFDEFLRAKGVELEDVGRSKPVVESCTSKAFKRLTLPGVGRVPIRIATWLSDGDSVLYINIPLRAFRPS